MFVLSEDKRFAARRYDSATYAVALCPSVRLSITSQADIVPKWLKTGSRKQRGRTAQGFYFSDASDLGVKFDWGHSQRRTKCRWSR